MGITAKIWSATNDDLEKSLHNPDHVDKMFHQLSDQQYALIHDARKLAYKELFAYKTICVNRVEIIDIVTHAATGDLGIIACVFEDY